MPCNAEYLPSILE